MIEDQVGSSAAGERPNWLSPGEALEVVFAQTRAGPLDLVLDHRAIQSYQWGFCSIAVSLDGVAVAPRWAPPSDGHLVERLSLGHVDVGPRVVRVEVRPRAPTPYEIEALWIEPQVP